jgi:hypothetical protein
MGAFLALGCLPCLALPCNPTECQCTCLLSRRKRLLKSRYLGNMIDIYAKTGPAFLPTHLSIVGSEWALWVLSEAGDKKGFEGPCSLELLAGGCPPRG